MMYRIAPTLLLMTACFGVQAQLIGTYTVGGTSPDYATLTAALDDLSAQGATGSVTFNLRPGTYTGQYSLVTIAGTPGFITIKSENNDPSSVVLAYDAAGTTDNYILRLDGTDRMVLSHLTFRPLDPFYARAIHFFNACAILSIQQCVFEGSTDPDQSSGFERHIIHCDQNVIGTVDNPQDVMISENSFLNGYAALELDFEGSGGARSEGLIITENLFEDQYATGVYVSNALGQIGDNLIKTSQGIFFTGIRTNFFDGGSQIRRNVVQAYATFGGCTGIEVGNTQNTTGNMISNNMVYCSAPGDVWGIAVYNLWDMKIVHNSVLIAEANPFQCYAFYHLSGFPDGQDAVVRNNIFANAAGGHAYNVDVADNVAVEDHNCLFTTGPNLSEVGSGFYANLADHQNGSGMGAGDTDIDPVFPIQPDLHMNNCAMDDMGQYFFVVAADIDGDARGNPVCDMGADEYTASTNAMQAPPITILSSDLPYDLGLNATFSAYNWSTGATTPTTTITAGGNYSCDVMDANFCTFSINITVIVDINTAVNEVVSSTALLYPNPATEQVTLTGLVGTPAYTIQDPSGREVLRGRFNSTPAVDVRGLVPGVYTMRIDDAVVRTARFVKH